MTGNAVAWNQMLEDRRANQAREFETNRHNIRTEQEAKRSNLASEQVEREKAYAGLAGSIVKAIF